MIFQSLSTPTSLLVHTGSLSTALFKNEILNNIVTPGGLHPSVYPLPLSTPQKRFSEDFHPTAPDTHLASRQQGECYQFLQYFTPLRIIQTLSSSTHRQFARPSTLLLISQLPFRRPLLARVFSTSYASNQNIQRRITEEILKVSGTNDLQVMLKYHQDLNQEVSDASAKSTQSIISISSILRQKFSKTLIKSVLSFYEIIARDNQDVANRIQIYRQYTVTQRHVNNSNS